VNTETGDHKKKRNTEIPLIQDRVDGSEPLSSGQLVTVVNGMMKHYRERCYPAKAV